MNYRHIYHAGNFADVAKHVLLVGLLQHLQAKPAAFCVLDTHAGTGLHDLESVLAKKTAEAAAGIARLWPRRNEPGMPALVRDYLRLIETLNPDGRLRWYPGSPRIAAALRRPQDRLLLNELHTEDHRWLQENMKGCGEFSIHKRDAWECWNALLPFKEKRGLVLVDPSFEQPDEWKQVLQSLQHALQRWPQGMMAIWYPIKNREERQRFERQLRRLQEQGLCKSLLFTSLLVWPDDVGSRLNGSAMVIVNPPWQFEQMAWNALKWLAPVLAQESMVMPVEQAVQVRRLGD